MALSNANFEKYGLCTWIPAQRHWSQRSFRHFFEVWLNYCYDSWFCSWIISCPVEKKSQVSCLSRASLVTGYLTGRPFVIVVADPAGPTASTWRCQAPPPPPSSRGQWTWRHAVRKWSKEEIPRGWMRFLGYAVQDMTSTRGYFDLTFANIIVPSVNEMDI